MIPIDKRLHMLAGAVLFALAQPFGLPVAGNLVLAGAIGKEAWDTVMNARAASAGQVAPHDVDGLDALATMAGGALMWLGLQASAALAQAWGAL